MSNYKMKGFVVAIVLTLMVTAHSYGQTYSSALGVRVGGTSGITFKHFYKNQMAWEGQLGTFGNGTSITGLIMQHGNAFSTPGLRYYAGGGAHVAFYNGRTYSVWKGRDITYYGDNSLGIGLNGILGLEYILPDVPIGFSLDIKPFIEMGPAGRLGFSPDPSIGIKFIIH
jgi:hypothetical protein